jgi:hypothetical protein
MKNIRTIFNNQMLVKSGLFINKKILESKILNVSKETLKLILPSIFTMNNLFENEIGRWKLSNNKSTNIKVDQANEDHCGCCNIDHSQPKPQTQKMDYDKENYYSYFCS